MLLVLSLAPLPISIGFEENKQEGTYRGFSTFLFFKGLGQQSATLTRLVTALFTIKKNSMCVHTWVYQVLQTAIANYIQYHHVTIFCTLIGTTKFSSWRRQSATLSCMEAIEGSGHKRITVKN